MHTPGLIRSSCKMAQVALALRHLFDAELPECAGCRQFVRYLNPCVCEKLLMCGSVVLFEYNVRDLINLGFIEIKKI